MAKPQKFSVFVYRDYKEIMQELLMAADQRGQMSMAARSLGCQRSYLSRVLAENMHLTPDHAYKLCQFWRFNEDERNYFLTLVDYQRAGDNEYRQYLKNKIQQMIAKNEMIAERTNRKNLSVDSMQVEYFSNWLFSAIHFLTSIPQYQSFETLCQRLMCPPEVMKTYLEKLTEQGLIEKKEDKGKTKWIYRSGEFHVAKDSPLVLLHHQNWRNRAILDAQGFNQSHLHYTNIQTVSLKDFEVIKELMLRFISDASFIAGPSKPEEAICINCDIFRI